VAEINVLGAPVSVPLAVASVSLNPAVAAGGSSSTGTVTLNGPAPAGGAVVTLSNSNTSVATVPASVTVSAGNNTATFTVTTTSISSSTQVTIGGSYNGGTSQTATLTVNPGSLIPHTLWSVLSFDSQETSCQNGAASNAIDGNPSTMWVTQWCPSNAPLPHAIQINLGASYSLSAFQYLPRQDACGNGWIKQYAIYVSTDGVHWGTAVATGTFSYGGLSTACPGGGVPAAIQVNFTPVTGQYIELQALSEINGGPWTAVAEINAVGQ